MGNVCVDSIARPARAGQNARAFDALVEAYPVAEAVAAVAEVYWDDPAGFLESIEGARALKCAPREVRTVGAYHYTMGIGGAERVAAELLEVWHDTGKKVVFFADEGRDSCAYGIPEGVSWIRLPRGSANARSYGKRARKLADALLRTPIDAFVHHQWWNPLLTWDVILLKALGVPVCVILHTIYKVLFYDYNPLEYDHSRVMRHVDGLMTLSEFDQRFWQKFNPRVWVTPNPTTIFPTQARRAPLDSNEVVWVGRLSLIDKQPQEAIEIMARVVERRPDAHLTLVGPCSSRREQRILDRLVRRHGLENNVDFAGPQQDPGPYYERASVHLLTSRLDGWCLVLAESKAYGVPCVMYDMGYLTLTQGERGIISVAQGDRAGAARAVEALLDDRERRAKLGQDAFEHMSAIAQVDLAGIWERAFSELGEGSPERRGYDRDDAEWNLLLEGFKESADKATHLPLRSYAKRKVLRLLGRG